MDGVFSEWECKRLCQIINEFIEANNKIKIDVEIAELSSQLKDLNNVSTYLRLFELYKILSGKNSFKNKLKIIAFGIISKDINKAVEKYYLEVADTLVVIEDNVGWNDSKLIKNIEINGRFDFEDPNPFFVNLGTKEIKLDYGGVEPHKKESNF